MKYRKTLILTLLLIFSFCLIGCGKTYFRGLNHQSNFDYPNSNVIPLKKVTGKASKTSLFSSPTVTSEFEKNAIENALSKAPEADILINYSTFHTKTDFLFIHTLTRRVDGTAAKMEIGTQKIE